MDKKEILFETERMLIREFHSADDVGMFELDSDKEVHKFLGNNPFKIIEQSKNLIAFVQQQYIENGIGRWAIVDKATDEFVGWTGFKWIKKPSIIIQIITTLVTDLNKSSGERGMQQSLESRLFNMESKICN